MFYRYAPCMAWLAIALTISLNTNSTLNGQSLAQWQNIWGGSNQDEILATSQMPDGGSLYVGTSNSTDANALELSKIDACILKTNALGKIEWQKRIGGTQDDQFYSVTPCKMGGFVAVGSSNSLDGSIFAPDQWIAPRNRGRSDAWVACFDDHGDMLWQQLLGGKNDDKAMAVREAPNGDIVVTGQTYSKDGNFRESHGSADLFVVRLNATGKILWSTQWGGSGIENASSGLCIAKDGGIWVAATTESSDDQVTWAKGGADVWLLNLSAKGKFISEKSFGGFGDDVAVDLQISKDNGLVLAANTQSNEANVIDNHGKTDFWLLQLDKGGKIAWQKTYGGTNHDEMTGLALVPNGGYALAGKTLSTDGQVPGLHGNLQNSDAWLVQTDPMGKVLHSETFGGAKSDQANCVQAKADGSIEMAGTHEFDEKKAGTGGFYDFWMLNLSGYLPTELTQNSTLCTMHEPIIDEKRMTKWGFVEDVFGKELAYQVYERPRYCMVDLQEAPQAVPAMPTNNTKVGDAPISPDAPVTGKTGSFEK